MPVESALPSVVVGGAASELRRALGPTSWMVLEELLLQSTGPADACVASVSVRALASSLGLAKDTVGRAIRRLRDAGLVTVAQQRTDAGIFDTGTYLIAVPGGITVNAPTQSCRPPRARVDHRRFSQLSLAIES
jgi:DNA-binding transcriptional ArsR family regulator